MFSFSVSTGEALLCLTLQELESFFGVTGGIPESSTLGPTPLIPEVTEEQLGCNLHKDPTAQTSQPPHAHPWSTAQPHLFHPITHPPSAALPLPAESFPADEALTTDLVAATAHGAHSFSPEEGAASSRSTSTASRSNSNTAGFPWSLPSIPSEQETPYFGASGQQQVQEANELLLLRQQVLEQSKLVQELCERLADMHSLMPQHFTGSSNSLRGDSNTLPILNRAEGPSSSSLHLGRQVGTHQTSKDQQHNVEAAAEAAAGDPAATKATNTSSSSSRDPVGVGLTHVDSSGAASMVDVSSKGHSKRVATASCRVLLGPKAFTLVQVCK